MRSKRFFVLPFGASDEGGESSAMDGLNDLLDGIGASDDEDVEDEQSDTNDDAGSEDDNDDAGSDDDEAQQKQNNVHNKKNQQDYTFAEMRRQNRAQFSLLKKLADSLGIEYANNKELVDKLNSNALDQISKKQNVPRELLERMEQLELTNEQFQQQQLRTNALSGFQQLADDYGLTNKQLQDFAAELDATDNNPFIKQVNVVTAYKTMHFDEIVQQQVQKAVQDALSKSNNVDQHSSTPNSHRGKGVTGGENISTVDALNSFLDGTSN